MRGTLIFFTVFIFLSLSCKRENDSIENYLKSSMNADVCEYTLQKDTICLKLKYTKDLNLSNEDLASVAALRCIDTLHKLDSNSNWKSIVISIENNQIEGFAYSKQYLKVANEGMEKSSAFLANFLNGINEKNAVYVDLDKISLAELYELNSINEQIQASMQVNSISFDGFCKKNEPNVIEYRAKLISKDEEMPVVFQYSTENKRIFYFGINEE